MLRAADGTVGFHAHQFRVAGAKARTDNLAHLHSTLLASAFTAATVMAEPPKRPCTIIEGTGRSASAPLWIPPHR